MVLGSPAGPFSDAAVCTLVILEHFEKFKMSVRPTRQLEVRADPKCFLPLSVRYSIIADGRRSCRQVFLAHATIDYI